jgi:antirestriction protein ArdC
MNSIQPSTHTAKYKAKHNAVVPPAPPEAHQKAEIELHRPTLESAFSGILNEALTEPGVLNAAYRMFHNYSLANQLLAAGQLIYRGMDLSPIASFNAWKEKGRAVKKGEKGIALFLPVTVKKRHVEGQNKTAAISNNSSDDMSCDTYQTFIMRANWFSLDQTDGESFLPEIKIPEWDAVKALATLGIVEEKFDSIRGNCMGYACERTIAINPLNPFKHKTRFHEIAHVMLGHTAIGNMIDGAEIELSVAEVEAESVAYVLCALLGLPGQPESRHYIQNWLGGQSLPEKHARRIFGAADKILKAGQVLPSNEMA